MLTSKESPNYSEIQRNFKTYKNIIRRSIMLAKRDYYIKTFSKYSKNLRMTWNAINETLIIKATNQIAIYNSIQLPIVMWRK